MKYVTDDGKHTFDSAEECLAFEAAQRIDGVISQEVGEYLDQCTMDQKQKDGTIEQVSLSGREFTRKETNILDWIRWDRQERPWRYEEKQAEETHSEAEAMLMGGIPQ